jgi:integrase
MRKVTDRYQSLLPVNKKAIQDFITYDNCKGNTPKTIATHESLLISFFKFLNHEKTFKTISLSAIEKVLTLGGWKSSSKEIIKQGLRRFLVFHKRKKLASKITLNCKVLSAVTKTIEGVLTPDEITRFIDVSLEPQYRALIEIFLVLDCRVGELQKLRVGSVVFDNSTIWFNIRISKTEIRRILVIVNPNNPCVFFPNNLE